MAETSIDDDLSQDLLIHILSFLPTIDAIRASLVSQQWRNLWHHIPTLNFDMSLYHSPPNHLRKSREIFAEFITQTLIRRPHSTLSTLSTSSSATATTVAPKSKSTPGHAAPSLPAPPSSASPSRRICLSKMRPTEKLTTIQNRMKSMIFISLISITPALLGFWNSSVTELFGLRAYPLMDFHLLFRLLCVMFLYVINYCLLLVSSCVNLEFLSLQNLHFLRNFEIHSATLKELELGFYRSDVGSLDICAQNLRAISFDCFSVAKYCCRDLSSLVEACLVFVRAEEDFDGGCDVLLLISGVERLTLRNMSLNRDLWPQVFDRKDISGCIQEPEIFRAANWIYRK